MWVRHPDRLQTALVLADHLIRSHHIRINILAPQLNPGAALHRRADEQLIQTIVTSQRYITAAGTETRTAAAQNKLYGLLELEQER